jgi:hypothetical protein
MIAVDVEVKAWRLREPVPDRRGDQPISTGPASDSSLPARTLHWEAAAAPPPNRRSRTLVMLHLLPQHGGAIEGPPNRVRARVLLQNSGAWDP